MKVRMTVRPSSFHEMSNNDTLFFFLYFSLLYVFFLHTIIIQGDVSVSGRTDKNQFTKANAACPRCMIKLMALFRAPAEKEVTQRKFSALRLHQFGVTYF